MKKSLALIAVGLVIVLAFLLFKPRPLLTPAIPPLPSPQPSSSALIDTLETIDYQNQTYHFAYYQIDGLDRLRLYPNFTNRLLSPDLVDKHHCSFLVNGGFYTTDNDPLGWLVSDYQELSPPLKSSLFNGYLTLDQNLSITPILLYDQTQLLPRLALQSGPLLILDGKPLILAIKDDQPRRRLIAAQTAAGQLVFLAITGKDSLFTGPLLADTPQVLNAIARQLNQTFTAALNLDGGSASAFYTPNLQLEEFSFIGSFFCLN